MRIWLVLAAALIAVSIAIANASEIASPNSGHLQYREIHAEDILAEANNSSVEYDRVSIIGDLVLDEPQYNSIKITNSDVEGNVSCKGIAFYGNVDFSNTSFHKERHIQRNQVHGRGELQQQSFLWNRKLQHVSFFRGRNL